MGNVACLPGIKQQAVTRLTGTTSMLAAGMHHPEQHAMSRAMEWKIRRRCYA